MYQTCAVRVGGFKNDGVRDPDYVRAFRFCKDAHGVVEMFALLVLLQPSIRNCCRRDTDEVARNLVVDIMDRIVSIVGMSNWAKQHFDFVIPSTGH